MSKMSEKLSDEEKAVIKDVLQKAYSRWVAIRKAKKLVDIDWLNEMVERLPHDPVLINVIEGLLAGESIESLAADAQSSRSNLISNLKSWGIEVNEEL